MPDASAVVNKKTFSKLLKTRSNLATAEAPPKNNGSIEFLHTG